jgi:CheY-like chemotaxis protein
VPPLPIDLSGLTVLLVDDDEDQLELLTHLLSAQRAGVISAAHIADAKHRFSAARPDVVVSDLVMPDGGGYALIEHIRRLPDGEGRFVPAIAMSSALDEGTRRTALRAGFWRFVGKPVDADLLCSEISVIGSVYRQVVSTRLAPR